MNKQTLLFILFTTLFLFNFHCGEVELACPDLDQQTSTVQVSIERDTAYYNVGDTIWLGANFDTDLEVLESNSTLNVADGFGWLNLLIMRFSLRQSSDLVTSGYSNFEIIQQQGEVSNSSLRDSLEREVSGLINLDINNNVCRFLIGLVPINRGFYCIGLESGIIYSSDTTDCPPQARLMNNSFAVSNLNRELYREVNYSNSLWLPRPAGGRRQYDVLNNDGVFTFKVE